MPDMPPAFSLALLAALAVLSLGADAVGAERDDRSGPWIGAYGGGGRLGGSGAFGGVTGGYAVQFDSLVIGLDGDVAAGGIDARRGGGTYEIEAFGTIRARVGYAFDRFVAFGTAGVAFASAEFGRAGDRDEALHAGWTVGAGVDVALTERLSARAEYLYVDLDRRDFDPHGGVSFEASGGLARLGLNYRF